MIKKILIILIFFSLTSCVTQTHIRSYNNKETSFTSGIFILATKSLLLGASQKNIQFNFENIKTKEKFNVWRNLCTKKTYGPIGNLFRKIKRDQITEKHNCGNFLVADLNPGTYKMRYVSIGNSTVKSKQAYGVNRMDYDILKTFTVASEKITYLGNILVTPIEENVGGGMLSMSINMKDNHTNDYELFNKNYPKLSVLKKHNESIKTLQTLEY